MKIHLKLVLILTISVLSACENVRVPSAVRPSDQQIVEFQENSNLVPGEKIYAKQIQVRLSETQGLEEFVHSAALEQGVVLRLVDQMGERPIYLFEIDEKADPRKISEKLKENSRVVSASPNHLIKIEGFNDPDFRWQWAIENRGQDIPGALAGKARADIAWRPSLTSQNDDVVVAIIDTGIDYWHEDLSVTEVVNGQRRYLSGNMWVNPAEIPGNGVDDDNSGFIDDVFGYNFVGRNGDPMDDHGHGTHIAGVIGALQNNFKGIAGMNAQVKMMAVRFLGAAGGGSDWGAQQAIYYVIEMKKRFPEKKFIMNCSWGSEGRESRNGDADDFLMQAFREADENGILSVVAAGNSGLSTRFFPFYPANYGISISSILTVAATNNVDQLASFSNYGFDSVHVAAPGVLIHSTLPGNRYEAWSGTSMAAPHVAGLAAMIWQQNPEMSALQIKDRILSTVDVLPQLKGLVSSGGRINVKRALAGDINVRLAPVEESQEFHYRSLQHDGTRNVDLVETLTAEGASEIQVCFREINLTNNFDFIQIFGSDYRIRDIITGQWRNKNFQTKVEQELCSAPVPGDRIHIRLFGNAQAGGGEFGRRGFETESLRVLR
jgi:subtilisin family serine protease